MKYIIPKGAMPPIITVTDHKGGINWTNNERKFSNEFASPFALLMTQFPKYEKNRKIIIPVINCSKVIIHPYLNTSMPACISLIWSLSFITNSLAFFFFAIFIAFFKSSIAPA